MRAIVSGIEVQNTVLKKNTSNKQSANRAAAAGDGVAVEAETDGDGDTSGDSGQFFLLQFSPEQTNSL